MSFQRSRLLRDVVLSRFILLIFIIMNYIYGLKSSTSPWTTYTQFYDSRSRQLSEYLHRMYRTNTLNYYRMRNRDAYEYVMEEESRVNEEYKRRFGDASRSYCMPYRIDEEEVSRELSEKEIKKLLKSFGPTISERDMYITFYYYHSYLQRCYAEMLLQLQRMVYKLGSKREIPDEDLNEYWIQCKKKLGRLLFSLNYFSCKKFYDFARDAPFEDTLSFATPVAQVASPTRRILPYIVAKNPPDPIRTLLTLQFLGEPLGVLKVNMNKMYLSRFITRALFFLLNIQSLDFSGLSELNLSCESQPGSSHIARQLAESAVCRKNNVDAVKKISEKYKIKITDVNGKNDTGKGKHAEEDHAEINEGNVKLLFGIEESEISNDLSKEEINKLIDSFGNILTQKQQYIIFHHYTKYLNKIYNKMVDKIWDVSERLAFKHQVPHEVKVKYWYQCEKELKNDLKEMNNFSYKNFYSFMKQKPSQPAIKFKLFLSLHHFTWNKEMKDNEQKRVHKLVQKMKNYKKKGHGHHMG
ncbi:Uncharacterized protein PCOAH_00022610 [Plasmodium coatneyi]|uniref:Plasmodium RESA N-terminal domain-containing protein n=1 Tax=Plasmodium coatneyi TaxID=208452 RepID=A0A1B1DYE8_9APIC|nr:Uncharacterized protein PCOAH_00022610 [Plasmodium coatneyi]ANQ07794.1 Uncharacterized protein PCOAH_00022610 [Plasmodium coatneyi]